MEMEDVLPFIFWCLEDASVSSKAFRFFVWDDSMLMVCEVSAAKSSLIRRMIGWISTWWPIIATRHQGLNSGRTGGKPINDKPPCQ